MYLPPKKLNEFQSKSIYVLDCIVVKLHDQKKKIALKMHMSGESVNETTFGISKGAGLGWKSRIWFGHRESEMAVNPNGDDHWVGMFTRF